MDLKQKIYATHHIEIRSAIIKYNHKKHKIFIYHNHIYNNFKHKYP
jgi:hypothetical protein